MIIILVLSDIDELDDDRDNQYNNNSLVRSLSEGLSISKALNSKLNVILYTNDLEKNRIITRDILSYGVDKIYMIKNTLSYKQKDFYKDIAMGIYDTSMGMDDGKKLFIFPMNEFSSLTSLVAILLAKYIDGYIILNFKGLTFENDIVMESHILNEIIKFKLNDTTIITTKDYNPNKAYPNIKNVLYSQDKDYINEHIEIIKRNNRNKINSTYNFKPVLQPNINRSRFIQESSIAENVKVLEKIITKRRNS